MEVSARARGEANLTPTARREYPTQSKRFQEIVEEMAPRGVKCKIDARVHT